MSENENTQSAGITVPVKVGVKLDVTKMKPHSSVSVLFINTKGQAHMLPKDLADNHAKKGKGYIVERENPDYMKLFKMATGYDEKVGTKKFSQVCGRVVAIDETVNLDVKAIIDKEELAAAKARKDAERK